LLLIPMVFCTRLRGEQILLIKLKLSKCLRRFTFLYPKCRTFFTMDGGYIDKFVC
jgi:hypothetical protein